MSLWILPPYDLTSSNILSFSLSLAFSSTTGCVKFSFEKNSLAVYLPALSIIPKPFDYDGSMLLETLIDLKSLRV